MKVYTAQSVCVGSLCALRNATLTGINPLRVLEVNTPMIALGGCRFLVPSGIVAISNHTHVFYLVNIAINLP